MRAIGRETQWSFSGIASLWDEIFWKDKDITRKAMKESVQGVLAARALYKKLPKSQDLEIHSASNLTTYIDSGIQLSSSGDFLLSYSDRYEVWIYFKSTPKKIRRSSLPAIEHYIARQKIRAVYQKPFFLVCYHTNSKKRNPTFFRVRSDFSESQCRNIVLNLATAAKNKVNYPVQNDQCQNCEVSC